jgi:hypothetical protein
MSQVINAIVKDGQLVLKELLEFAEGESVEVTLRSHRDRVLAALGDLVVKPTRLSPYTEAEIEAMSARSKKVFAV